MFASNPCKVTVKGQPVELYVMRNNGDCWGRIVPADGPELDVSSRVDVYDWADEDAASMLLRRAQRGHTEPAAGWFMRTDAAAYVLPSNQHQIGYAYPSSPIACSLKRAATGCHYVQTSVELTGHDTYAEALATAAAHGTAPHRWSMDHPANARFLKPEDCSR